MSGRCAKEGGCVCMTDPPLTRSRCAQWRETDWSRPEGIFANSKEERRRRTAAQPDCARCRNKAPMGGLYCAACAPAVEAEREANNLTAEFHAIATQAGSMRTWAHLSARDLLDLIERLARAMAQARESE